MPTKSRFREFRKKSGFTQEVVATRLRVSIHTIRAWDQGLRLPKRSRIFDIAKLLKCDPLELI